MLYKNVFDLPKFVLEIQCGKLEDASRKFLPPWEKLLRQLSQHFVLIFKIVLVE